MHENVHDMQIYVVLHKYFLFYPCVLQFYKILLILMSYSLHDLLFFS